MLQSKQIETDGSLPYKLTVHYSKGCDIQGLLEQIVDSDKNFKELLNSDYSGCLSMVTSIDSNIYLLVKDNITMDTLLHECIHVTFRIFEKIGSSANLETEEFFAYITDFIFKSVYKILKEDFKLKVKVTD